MDVSSIHDSIGSVARAIVATLLAFAAIQKARGFTDFHRGLRTLTYLSKRSAWFVAVFVVASEFAISIGLLAGFAIAIWGAVLLFGSFAVVAWHVTIRGLQVSCNCFGADGETLSSKTISRNAVFVLLALLSLANPGSPLDLIECFQGATMIMLWGCAREWRAISKRIHALVEIGGLPS